MTQTLSHLRYPLTALALIVISACGGGAQQAANAPGA
ncbi:multidrug efflux RND membrane fusion protein MexE, partial [Pseudomonas syringae pv. actinidiae ICMP 19070]